MEPYNYSGWDQAPLIEGEYEPEFCFLAGTRITMANGSFKNIEDIVEGDFILSWDFENEEPAPAMIKRTWTGPHDCQYTINGHINVTWEHPFWTQEVGWASINPSETLKHHHWAPAEIKVGYHMMDADGNWIFIKSIVERPGEEMTYNLVDVEGYHNYFAEEVLVHNKLCFMPDTPINMANGSYKEIKDIGVGELVKVFDEETMSVEDAPVTSTQTKMHNDVHEVHFENGKVLRPTANHPFYTVEKGWATIDGTDELGLNCEMLEIGDHVYQMRSDDDLEEIQIVDIIPVDGNYLTYNFVDMRYGTYLSLIHI